MHQKITTIKMLKKDFPFFVLLSNCECLFYANGERLQSKETYLQILLERSFETEILEAS